MKTTRAPKRSARSSADLTAFSAVPEPSVPTATVAIIVSPRLASGGCRKLEYRDPAPDSARRGARRPVAGFISSADSRGDWVVSAVVTLTALGAAPAGSRSAVGTIRRASTPRAGARSAARPALTASARGGRLQGGAPLPDRFDDGLVDRGHRAVDAAEPLPAHDEHPHRRDRLDRRRTALLVDQRHLAEELPRAQLGDRRIPAQHLRGPVDDHEELLAELALAGELLPQRNVDLVRLLRDGGQLPLGQPPEERNVPQLGLVHPLRSSLGSGSATVAAPRLRRNSGGLHDEDRAGRLVRDGIRNAPEDSPLHALAADDDHVGAVALREADEDFPRVALGHRAGGLDAARSGRLLRDREDPLDLHGGVGLPVRVLVRGQARRRGGGGPAVERAEEDHLRAVALRDLERHSDRLGGRVRAICADSDRPDHRPVNSSPRSGGPAPRGAASRAPSAAPTRCR